MRIAHISDSHGNFPAIPDECDIVVHSGDFLPDSNIYWRQNNKIMDMKIQRDWLEDNMHSLKYWLKDKPFLFCSGNHDFLDANLVENMLCSGEIEAICLNDKITNYEGTYFYGFPYTPEYTGLMAYERNPSEMLVETDKMAQKLNQELVNVIVAHAPVYQILDVAHNQHIGIKQMSSALQFKIHKDMMPTHYLHGHCHQGKGIKMEQNILFSNAATAVHIIEI